MEFPAKTERDIRAALDPEFELSGPTLCALRIDLRAARGSAATHAIERSIRNAPLDRYELALFTGQVGSGKTTELRWLAEQLSETRNGQRFEVLYIDLRDHLTPRDVRLPEFLLAIFGALLAAPTLGPSLTKTKSDDLDTKHGAAMPFWEFVHSRLGRLVTELSHDPTIGSKSLAASLRTEVGLQRRVGEALNSELDVLLTMLGDVLRAAREVIRTPPKSAAAPDEVGAEDLVMLVDGLDRVAPQVFDDGRTSHDALYIDQLPQLRALPAHIVLTAPLDFLRRTTRASTVFNTPPRVLPMVPVHAIVDPSTPHKEGIACLKEVLQRRIDIPTVFADEEALSLAIQLSGGSLRQLFRIVIEAITAADEGRALDSVDIDRGCQPYVLEFERAIRGRPWVRDLHTVHRTGQFPDDFPPQTQQDLLSQHIVFEYNGTLWYDVNPLVLRTGAWRVTAP